MSYQRLGGRVGNVNVIPIDTNGCVKRDGKFEPGIEFDFLVEIMTLPVEAGGLLAENNPGLREVPFRDG